jgi:hypothetical protein
MFTKKEDELCEKLGWLACHADEDVEYKSKHLKMLLITHVLILKR